MIDYTHITDELERRAKQAADHAATAPRDRPASLGDGLRADERARTLRRTAQQIRAESKRRRRIDIYTGHGGEGTRYRCEPQPDGTVLVREGEHTGCGYRPRGVSEEFGTFSITPGPAVGPIEGRGEVWR